ncbi:MAG: gamma-glutamyl-gamma-aminobutyrate hydrolase family protein [Bacillota bacterium]
MRPLIGISCWQNPESLEFFVPEAYVQALRKAGAIPALVPYVGTENEAAEALSRLDGLLLSGGVDLDPVHWGEEPYRQMGRIDPSRDRSELLLARRALSTDLPVLGICRGLQVLAVASGGSLWQDLHSQVASSLKHDQNAPRWYPTHGVRLTQASRLASWLGTEIRVNSFHHQAVRQAPPGFTAVASAPDGVIEALEHQTHPFAIGVQWHPECFWNQEKDHNALFLAFVEAARSRAGHPDEAAAALAARGSDRHAG